MKQIQKANAMGFTSDRMVRLDAPGIYLSVPAHHYHADPCPEPSMSSGIAKKAALQTCRHIFHAHPRLNPNYDPSCDDEIKRKTAQGAACHELFLGIGGGIKVIDVEYEKKCPVTKEKVMHRATSFAPKVAQEARDQAIADKMTPRLWNEIAEDRAIVEEAKAQLSWFDMSGDPEAVVITEQDGFWSRSMCDTLRSDDLTILDLKFTKIIADEDAFGRHAYNMGYDIQVAHYCRNLARIRGVDPLDVKFCFICIECSAGGPVMTIVHELEPALRAVGMERLAKGEEVWQRALKENDWPGYAQKIHSAKIPQWALSQHIRASETANV